MSSEQSKDAETSEIVDDKKLKDTPTKVIDEVVSAGDSVNQTDSDNLEASNTNDDKTQNSVASISNEEDSESKEATHEIESEKHAEKIFESAETNQETSTSIVESAESNQETSTSIVEEQKQEASTSIVKDPKTAEPEVIQGVESENQAETIFDLIEPKQELEVIHRAESKEQFLDQTEKVVESEKSTDLIESKTGPESEVIQGVESEKQAPKVVPTEQDETEKLTDLIEPKTEPVVEPVQMKQEFEPEATHDDEKPIAAVEVIKPKKEIDSEKQAPETQAVKTEKQTVETQTQKEKINAREYLKSITPILQAALIKLATEQPEDSIDFLIDCLLEAKNVNALSKESAV